MTTRMFGHLVVPTLSASAKRSAVVTRHLGWMALGIVSSPATAIALCESNNENNNTPSILDTIFPKDDNGKIYWEKASKQVTESIFWDKLAKAAGQKIQNAVDSGVPTNISYGFVSGYCSGMALKKVGKALSVVLGLGFISLQTLNYYGYVKVDHGQLERDFNDMLDLNKDGKVDAEDGKIVFNKIMKVLEFNLPAGGGFAAGFVGGLRSG